MGIKGLLPFLRRSCRSASLNEYSGSTVAVDASCWLHKGAFACADRLATKEQTNIYVHYCLKLLNLLLSFRLHVILVFDGARLPAKKLTNESRNERRQAMKAKGKQLLAEGRRSEAYECFKQCTQISFEMISDVIGACLKLPNVDCIIAPYEADAQLAYFSINNIAQLVITEDSDLVLFGCSNILFKMDACGRGYLYDREKLGLSLPPNVDFNKFRRACILAGCDYLQGLNGVGLTKAVKFFSKTSRTDLRKVLPFVGMYLRMPSLKVSKDFIEAFINAENAFLYQPIFDIISRRRKPLNKPIDASLPEVYAIDGNLNGEEALSLAVGNINPQNGECVNDFDFLSTNPRSIWFKDPVTVGMKENYEQNMTQSCSFSSKTRSKIIERVSSPSPRKLKSPRKRKRNDRSDDECDSILIEYECERAKKSAALKISRYFVGRNGEEGHNSEKKNGESALQLLDRMESSSARNAAISPDPAETKISSNSRNPNSNLSNALEFNIKTPPRSPLSSPIFHRTASSGLMAKFRKTVKFGLYSPKKSDGNDFGLTSPGSTRTCSNDSGFVDKIAVSSADSSELTPKILPRLIDLTLEADSDSGSQENPQQNRLFANKNRFTQQTCRPVGLSKRKLQAKQPAKKKQMQIRDSLAAFAFQRK